MIIMQACSLACALAGHMVPGLSTAVSATQSSGKMMAMAMPTTRGAPHRGNHSSLLHAYACVHARACTHACMCVEWGVAIHSGRDAGPCQAAQYAGVCPRKQHRRRCACASQSVPQRRMHGWFAGDHAVSQDVRSASNDRADCTTQQAPSAPDGRAGRLRHRRGGEGRKRGALLQPSAARDARSKSTCSL